MGLLDWLNEGIGSTMGGAPPSSAMPPMQDPGSSGAMNLPPPPPQIGDGGAPAPMSPPPSSPPPPMPPVASDGSDGDVLPPGATPTGGTGLLPPGAIPPPANGPSQGFIGRALGLDRNTAKTLSGSLASGLKSVGDNVHKPGLAAFAGSAGSALEGGNTADDKISDQQTKYLTQAIAAAKTGNETALNLARTKLALAQAKAAEQGDPEKTALTVARTRESTARARKLEEGSGGKASVVNSPEQLYLRAVGATNSDGKLSLLKQAYVQASKDGQQDTPAAKAAKEAYEKAYDETRDQHLKTLGVDPKIAQKIGKQAGFSADNPIPSAGLTQDKFNQLPVGAYFINPKDGRLLIKQPPAGANPQSPGMMQETMTSVSRPLPSTDPASSSENDE